MPMDSARRSGRTGAAGGLGLRWGEPAGLPGGEKGVEGRQQAVESRQNQGVPKRHSPLRGGVVRDCAEVGEEGGC